MAGRNPAHNPAKRTRADTISGYIPLTSNSSRVPSKTVPQPHPIPSPSNDFNKDVQSPEKPNHTSIAEVSSIRNEDLTIECLASLARVGTDLARFRELIHRIAATQPNSKAVVEGNATQFIIERALCVSQGLDQAKNMGDMLQNFSKDINDLLDMVS
ncbi:unnamed protein product [Protopolystoma xenopodis]|uniref:Uncharacterized protein n=1 Tax=Protopolystoma xenopodis TaxID=117903 RepID=A0A448WJ39_9PLAT|nr:unnamed protein product [Protopolystoma xenopodis]